MLHDVSFKAAAVCAALALGGVLGTALGAEAGKKPVKPAPRPEVVPGGTVGVKPMAPGITSFKGRPIIRHKNPFEITIPRSRLPRSTSRISEILLEMYNPEKGENGKWVGYGLMDLTHERVKGGDVRVAGARIDFVAPAEGIYCLRAVPRDEAGNFKAKPRDLTNVEWVVVLDRTKPEITLLSPGPGEELGRGSRLVVKWTAPDDFPVKRIRDAETRKMVGSNRVWISRDGGNSWACIKELEAPGKYEWDVAGPNTDAFLVRVTVEDAAGNIASATLALKDALKITGFEPAHLARKPSAARRTYQRGVIYMTRGDYEPAAKEFKEAIRLDNKLVRAYVDLSATYLHLFEKHRRADKLYARRYLQDARVTCEAALQRSNDVALHYNLAQVYRRQAEVYHQTDKLKRAAASLEQGLTQKPRHIESLYALAWIRYKQEDFAETRKLLKQVAALGGSKHPLARRAVRFLNQLRHEKVRSPRQAKASTSAPGLRSSVN